MAANNLDVIRELYRAFKERDHAAFRAIAAPDLQWVQNKGFPGGNTHVGAEAVIDGVFEMFSHEWDDWHFEIEEMHDVGSRVIVLGVYSGKHRKSDQSFEAPAAHIYDLADGKVTRFRQYTDTVVIRDAMV